MHFNTDFIFGKIPEIINNPSYSESMKLFASLSTCDNSGILKYSQILRDNQKINEQCLFKILIFTAAINLVSKNRNTCVEILNKLGAPSFEKVRGWQQSFFYSTWQLLLLQLKALPNIYKSFDDLNIKDKKIIIGDSHIFGMIPGLINNLNYSFNYIPGLRYSLVSSPQDNLKKVAIRNAMANSYEFDQVIFSIGEIDTRSYLIEAFNQNHYSHKYTLEYFKNIFQDSVNYINRLLSRNQYLCIIIPPPPFKIDKERENNNDLPLILNNYSAIINELLIILEKNKVKYIEYPKNIVDEDGFVLNTCLIDHAHFHQDIYMELLGFEKLLVDE